MKEWILYKYHWKFLYQGLNNNWLRRIAYGRDVFVLPFDNIGTTVFVAELVQQLKSRNVDLDRLAGYRSRQQGTNLQQKEATQQMAREIAQHLQSWLPTTAAPDPTSQQRILDLEAEIAKLKASQGDGSTHTGPTPSASTPASPIVQSLQGRSPNSSTFEPASLLVLPGTTNTWLDSNPISSLTETTYRKWLKDLQLPQRKMDTLKSNLTKALEWWHQQPDNASHTISRVIVAMGMEPTKLKPNTSYEVLIKVITVALTCSS